MQVKDIMSRDVCIAKPDQTICEAAKLMAERDIGALPVGENDRLVGVITDRDIAVRGVAEHKSPDTAVREVMSSDVRYCFEDEDTSDLARNLGSIQLHRLPVLTREKRLVGIVSIADLANFGASGEAGQAVAGISRDSARH